MRIPARVRSIEEPQFDLLNNIAAAHRARGADVITLGQAIPGFPPPQSAVAALRAALDDTSNHVYSADAGVAELREALIGCFALIKGPEGSGEVRKGPEGSEGVRGGPEGSGEVRRVADPEREVIITAGGNQAFMLALMTLVDPGDEIILPGPYFLNHEMAVQSIGAVPVEAPLDPFDPVLGSASGHAQGFVPRWDAIERRVGAKTRGVVICSPSNPTGAVCPPDELQRIVDGCRARGLVCFIDETYLQFVYDTEPFPAIALDGWRDTVVVIGSFSKAYAITGWRLGYMIANADVIAQAMKIQDSMLICASVPVQRAITATLQTEPRYPAQFLDELRTRRDYLVESLGRIPGLSPVRPGGGFFVMVKTERREFRNSEFRNSRELATALIEQQHVVTIPGRFFGETGEGFLRLSYGNAGVPRLSEAVTRIERFFD